MVKTYPSRVHWQVLVPEVKKFNLSGIYQSPEIQPFLMATFKQANSNIWDMLGSQMGNVKL